MQLSTPTSILNPPFVLGAHAPGGVARAAVCLLLVLGLAGALGSGPAAAQSSSPSADEKAYTDHWRAHFDVQTARMLRQRAWSRASQIRSVIGVAAELDRLDLSKTAEALFEIIESDSTVQHRRLAVRALRKIGPEHLGTRQYERAMERLYALMQEEPSRKVRNAGAKALALYLRTESSSTR